MIKFKYESMTDDLLFKYLFTKEEIVTDFLNSLFSYLSLETVNIKYIIPEKMMQAEKQNVKNFYGDIVLTLEDGEIISLECYNNFEIEEFNKSMAYICRLYSRQLKKNEAYKESKKVTSINIVRGLYQNKEKRFNKGICF